MSEFTKIGYYDLKLENAGRRLPDIVGLENEVGRLSRVLSRELQHNAIISAPSGSGKTAFIQAWAKAAAQSKIFAGKKIVLLDPGTLQKIGQVAQSSLSSYQEAFLSLEKCVLIIDSFGEMVYQSPGALQNWNTLLKPLFFKKDVGLVLTMQPEELLWITENKSHFLSHFETIKLESQSPETQLEVLKQALNKFSKKMPVEDGVLELILKLCSRFPILGQLPKSAIQLLDESLAENRAHARGASSVAEDAPLQAPVLTKSLIEKIVAEKTGVPLARLNADDKVTLKLLPGNMKTRIIGQEPALSRIVSVIQRAKLGLRNHNKPLGSFLLLGPSGVGKTETAKILASELYGSEKHFLRIDMSEFGESHATARMLGSPAGYVGYEQGGQLTNHFKNYPYSLLLLDEIEKAHPKIFDIFLQIFDDGRITSAQGETVDLTQSIIMATSNLAVNEILEGFGSGQDVYNPDFIKANIFPKLLEHFRMEFLNRFDEIIIYKPLYPDELADIALLEIAKIEARMREHNIKFSITKQLLLKKVTELADPRFGARPVKRFVEEACENLITQQLLK